VKALMQSLDSKEETVEVMTLEEIQLAKTKLFALVGSMTTRNHNVALFAGEGAKFLRNLNRITENHFRTFADVAGLWARAMRIRLRALPENANLPHDEHREQPQSTGPKQHGGPPRHMDRRDTKPVHERKQRPLTQSMADKLKAAGHVPEEKPEQPPEAQS
jgi:hypothetical protein